MRNPIEGVNRKKLLVEMYASKSRLEHTNEMRDNLVCLAYLLGKDEDLDSDAIEKIVEAAAEVKLKLEMLQILWGRLVDDAVQLKLQDEYDRINGVR